MGSTHRTYELKEKNISLLEATQLVWKMNEALCVGPKKIIYHEFSLTDPNHIREIQTKFDVEFSNLYSSFTVHKFNALNNLLISPHLFDQVSLSNVKINTDSKDYLHYWIDIDSSSNSFYIKIVLPITENFKLIKS